jgi:hypothetical protein
MADISTPEWLAKRGGAVRPGTVGESWLVVLNGEAQYKLVPVPAEGRYACQVEQTVNGRRFDAPGIYPSAGAAVHAGLEALRKALGW